MWVITYYCQWNISFFGNEFKYLFKPLIYLFIGGFLVC